MLTKFTPRIFKKISLESILFFLLILLTVILRFYKLGYSNFYGDETKTIYWNKTIPAQEFLLNQRKGPVQLIVVWVVETVTGGFGEGVVRFPFAVAGTIAVVLFYLILRKWFDWRVAIVGAFLFSTNGLFIAFSRTAQYQSFLWMFGFLSIYLILLATTASNVTKNLKKSLLYFGLSGVSLGLAFLCHYDAIFFVLPNLWILVEFGLKKFNKKYLVKIITTFLIPLIFVASTFYLPYFLGGYFYENFVGYLARRIDISNSTSSTFLTYSLYNRFVFSWVLLLLGFVYPLTKEGRNKSPVAMSIYWFLLPYIVFELIFTNPGTHIQQYIIPIIILSSAGMVWLIDISKTYRVQDLITIFLVSMAAATITYQVFTFLPSEYARYPWNKEIFASSEDSLFIYGFPYNRGWKEIGAYLKSVGAKSFYTTDNVTIGEYYILGIPANNHSPQYFIDVSENQLFRKITPSFEEKVLGMHAYVLEKKIKIDDRTVAKIYKKSVPRILGENYLFE